jgi:ligand-binding SRPBCC domain-containing protein
MRTVRLTFETRVSAPVDEMWAWSTSFRGVALEMAPVLKISVPKKLKNIVDSGAASGRPLCNCWFLLLGIFPIEMSHLTFVEFEPGRRFLEQSPMFSMRLWRHERIVTAVGGGTRVTDNLEFSPRFAAPLVKWFVGLFFQHRHAVLSRQFG